MTLDADPFSIHGVLRTSTDTVNSSTGQRIFGHLFPILKLSFRAAKLASAWTLSSLHKLHRCPRWTNVAYQDLFIMAAQAALIAETIAGMKRAISRAYCG